MASSTVFVSNFPFATTEEELRARFEELCGVRSVRIIVDRETGRSRGFAFIELMDPSAIDGVIESLDGSDLKGRRLAVSRARGRAAGGAENAPARPPAGRAEAPPRVAPQPFRHRIVIDWVEESGVYSASVPDLGLSASGQSIEAAVRAVQARAERPHDPGDEES